MFLPLIVIAWLYVVVMMSVAEATNSTGTVLGAMITFFLYGLGPVALLVYLLSTPARRNRQKEREAVEQARVKAAPDPLDPQSPNASGAPDAGSQATTHPVAPVRKEP